MDTLSVLGVDELEAVTVVDADDVNGNLGTPYRF